MNGDILETKVVVTNPQGFHIRPLTAFAETASRFTSTVTVCKEDKQVNGKSPIEMMFLNAPQGTELLIQVRGPDAREALAALLEAFNQPVTQDAP